MTRTKTQIISAYNQEDLQSKLNDFFAEHEDSNIRNIILASNETDECVDLLLSALIVYSEE